MGTRPRYLRASRIAGTVAAGFALALALTLSAQEKLETKRSPLVATVAMPVQPALPVPLVEDAP